MSAKQVGLVWELDLPHNEAWVLMAMADHADHDGRNVYPGIPLLAWKTGYTSRQVRRILATLQTKGLIVVEEPGGGRRTTRYRLELLGAPKKVPATLSPSRATPEAHEVTPESRGDILSPLDSRAAMSGHTGQNVRAARTQPRHPNRQGRETTEPSAPPPSSLPPPAALPEIAAPPGRADGGRESHSIDEREELRRECCARCGEGIRAAYAAWPGRERVAPESRDRFERQVERLATGEDDEAWTHPRSGAVVPAEDRARMFGLGLGLVADGTSRSPRGGVMYAVAKHYRVPPPVAGTEHAVVVAQGTAAEEPGGQRQQTATPRALVAVGVVIGAQDGKPTTTEDPVECWERDHARESAALREDVARQLAADVKERQISERTVRMIGRAQYRQLVLQRLGARA